MYPARFKPQFPGISITSDSTMKRWRLVFSPKDNIFSFSLVSCRHSLGNYEQNKCAFKHSDFNIYVHKLLFRSKLMMLYNFPIYFFHISESFPYKNAHSVVSLSWRCKLSHIIVQSRFNIPWHHLCKYNCRPSGITMVVPDINRHHVYFICIHFG